MNNEDIEDSIDKRGHAGPGSGLAESESAGSVADEKTARKKAPKNKVKLLQQELQDSNDKLLRLKAEFDNYRRRTQRDSMELRAIVKISTIEEILPVLDHFKMAMDAIETSDDFSTLKEGMNLIKAEFDRRLTDLGVEKIPAVGLELDPNVHEAISTEHSAEVAEAQILREFKAGYRLGERLIRPASVVVSSGPEEKSDSQ